MTNRMLLSVLRTSVVLCFVLAALLSAPSSVSAEDYRMLIVREGGIDSETKLPTGKVIVGAGYIDGLEAGMTGTIWRKNKFKGQIDIADITVIEAKAYEAVCSYMVRHQDFYVLKKDRAALEPVERADADILAHGIDALDNGCCFQALLFFENIFCATQDNAFVQAKIQDCKSRVETWVAGGSTDGGPKMKSAEVRDCLELAERHHKYHNDLAADLYLKQVLSTDSTNAKAVALRSSVPVQDFTALLSTSRCE